MPGKYRRSSGYRAVMITVAVSSLITIGGPRADEPSRPAAALPDLSTVKPDLVTPPMTDSAPEPGKRVRVTRPEYAGFEVYHTLYLPRDWKQDRRYPVIVEYAGNGPYSNAFGDISTGRPEGSNLGYGVSGGKGFIWICMPYVNSQEKRLQTQWWGDVDATLTYCRRTIMDVCDQYGGDASAVILAGFSRGAIACGYLGLHNDEIAGAWRAFIAYSHYDGARDWPYPGADVRAATERLRRLRGRPSFICHEGQSELDRTRRFVEASGVEAPFTFRVTPYRNHSDAWVLRPSPTREELRAWLGEIIKPPKPVGGEK